MRGVPAEARCWVSPAGLLSWCVSFRFPVSLTGWMAGFRAFPVSLSPFIALRAFEKNARPRAHLFVYVPAPLLVLLVLPVLLVVLHLSGRPSSWCHLVLAPVLCWHGAYTSLRVGAVAPMLRLKPSTVAWPFVWPTFGRTGSSVNEWVPLHLCCSQAIDSGIVHCLADARPDWFVSERMGAVAPMLRLKPLTVALFIGRPTLGRNGGCNGQGCTCVVCKQSVAHAVCTFVRCHLSSSHRDCVPMVF